MPRRLVALALLLVVAVPPVAAEAGGRSARPSASALVRFRSCEGLTRFARTQLLRTRGTTGVPFRGDVATPATLRPPSLVPREGGPQPVLAASEPAAEGDRSAGEDFSTTNVQEAGVDEADLVKTDGRRLFVVTGGVLRTFDVTGPQPRALATLPLPGTAHQLLLRRGRLLVLAATGDAPPSFTDPALAVSPVVASQRVLLTEVDVSDPAAPAVARTMDLAGRLAGARLTGGTARVVVASSPEPVVADRPGELGRLAARATTSRFLPRTTIRSRITRRTFRRPVVPCSRVRHPRAFSGLDLLSVLTIDLDRGLFSVARDAVMAGAQDVYASPRTLVVASRRWDPEGPEGVDPTGGTTELHAFDAGAEPRTAYRGSGRVPGFLLNQFSLSEHEGALRVATTENAPFDRATGGPGSSVSGVSVLRAADGRLATVGRVTGLGPNEQIYAVRFLGDRGYVVTFRRTDPLYTLDLRDPERPRVAGELKVTGFSSYLHPVSETLLLGVGQDATEQGLQLGPQLSLFDVGDPARPRLVARADLGGQGGSTVDYDHHAFLWWPAASLAVLPLETVEYPDGRQASWFSGAVAFRVADGRLAEAGRITHPAPTAEAMTPPVGRSVVIGDRLLTLSSAGIATHRLGDLAPLAFTPLG